MTRTKGAKDLKKRKHRSDRFKKYVRKKGKLVPYKSKRNKGDPIKIWWWRRKPMSLDGYHKWHKVIRASIYRKVTEFGVRMDVDPSMISSKEAIENLALEHLYQGEWLMMMFSRGKNKFHTKPVKVCRVVIRESPDGLTARMTDNYRLFRYWFWSKS